MIRPRRFSIVMSFPRRSLWSRVWSEEAGERGSFDGEAGGGESGAMDSGAVDSGAVDSGELDSGALDSGALDIGV